MHFNAHWTKLHQTGNLHLLRSHFGYWKRIQLQITQIILCRRVVIQII